MMLRSHDSSEKKSAWKIVRTDTYDDLEGEIVEADEVTGECVLQVNGEAKRMTFGPGGIRIVGRARR